MENPHPASALGTLLQRLRLGRMDRLARRVLEADSLPQRKVSPRIDNRGPANLLRRWITTPHGPVLDVAQSPVGENGAIVHSRSKQDFSRSVAAGKRMQMAQPCTTRKPRPVSSGGLGHSRNRKLAQMKWQKIAYGALFVILLPALLCVWGAAARVSMPIYGSVPLGIAFACAGFALMAAAMFELWRFGGGLPMNAFPPPTMVSRGTFQFLPHPIYTGFVAVCLGISMMLGSATGLWLITPTIALACVALVVGYEHPDLL